MASARSACQIAPPESRASPLPQGLVIAGQAIKSPQGSHLGALLRFRPAYAAYASASLNDADDFERR